MIAAFIVLPALGPILAAFLVIVCWSILRTSSKDPHSTMELDCAQRISTEKLQAINKTWEEYYNLSLEGKALRLPQLASNGTSRLLTSTLFNSDVKRSSQVSFKEEPHVIAVE